MSAIDCRVVQDNDGNEYVQIPEGFAVCLVPREVVTGEWQECVAVRIVAEADGSIAALEVTNDEDWVTGPDAA